MTELGLKIQQGQIANLSGSFYEVLEAMLKWRIDSYEGQANYVKESFDAAKEIAQSAYDALQDQARANFAEGIAGITGGSAALLATGYGLKSSMSSARDLEGMQTNLRNAEPEAIGAQNELMQRPLTQEQQILENNRTRILRRDFFESNDYKNMDSAQTKAAYETLTPEQKAAFDNRLSESIKLKKDAGMRNSNVASATAQGVSTAVQGTGSVVASNAKRAQAEAEYAKAMANYLSQVAQVVNQMLTSLTSQATSSIENVLQTEGTIAAASTYRG